MAKLENKAKDNPKLEQRTLKDGRISLYLEYYLGRESKPILNELGEPLLYENGRMKGKPKYKIVHNRRKESLNLYLFAPPKTPIERNHNKETLQLAKKTRYEREQELLENNKGYRLKKDSKINFLDYFQEYIENYKNKDIRVLVMAFNRFNDFLAETPEYTKYTKSIKPDLLNKDMMVDFTEYLKHRSKGTGALTIYKRFKQVINYAIEQKVIKDNPCKGVSIKADEYILTKDILSKEEIEQLIKTHIKKQDPNIRKAFIFCLYCGLRFCDVKDLTFANIDYSNKLLKFEQNKTKGHSISSGVVIPLNDGLLKLIGEPTESQTKESLIFKLPSHTMCLKSLRRWVKEAGIDKHITWHCARHSFAVNILNNGANIKTVASLLGHSGLSQTEKYTRAIDSLKKEAINSLPIITEF